MQEVLPVPRQEELEVKYQVITSFRSEAQSSQGPFTGFKFLPLLKGSPKHSTSLSSLTKICVLEPCKSGPLQITLFANKVLLKHMHGDSLHIVFNCFYTISQCDGIE